MFWTYVWQMAFIYYYHTHVVTTYHELTNMRFYYIQTKSVFSKALKMSGIAKKNLLWKRQKSRLNDKHFNILMKMWIDDIIRPNL